MSARRCALLALSALLTGCAVHSVREDVSPPVALPDRYSGPAGTTTPPDRWWEAFGDPALTALVEEALSGNLALRQTWERLAQFEALARAQGADLVPAAGVNAEARRDRTVLHIDNRFALNVTAAYEVDVWRKIASRAEAAVRDAAASRQDAEATAVTLAANVAESWFVVLEQRARIALLREQIAASETTLEVVEFRRGHGLSTAVDVLQQRQQAASVRAQLPLAEAELELAMHRLAVLLGRAPGTLSLHEDAPLPELPPMPELGVPADLLTRRPDVRAAYERVLAADHQLAAAIAERYPALRLTAGGGTQADEWRDLFDNWIANLAANLTAPLLDGGRRAAEADRMAAVKRERLLAYGDTVLRALREVEDAMTQETRQREYLERLREQTRAARDEFAEARARYLDGQQPYLPVLLALQSRQQIERNLIAAERALLVFRVQLYKALGAAWTRELQPAVVDTPSNGRKTP